MKKKAEEKHNEMTGMMRWLLTYADLVTLLLIVFVVLFSISSQDAEKFKQLAQYMRAAFGGVLQQGPTFLKGAGGEDNSGSLPENLIGRRKGVGRGKGWGGGGYGDEE